MGRLSPPKPPVAARARARWGPVRCGGGGKRGSGGLARPPGAMCAPPAVVMMVSVLLRAREGAGMVPSPGLEELRR